MSAVYRKNHFKFIICLLLFLSLPLVMVPAYASAASSSGSSGASSKGKIDNTPDPSACAALPSLDGCDTDASADCGVKECDLVEKYVNPAIKLLTIVFGLIAAISIIMGGIQYSASTGDSQKVQAAKTRLKMTIIAIVAYAFLWSFLQFLVPGGIF